ncbi:hypothetical protein GCM10027271_13940 [Saccharopolyspora gloriosae]|uniref:Uncharacterized protein n=1 Tax=Saccharopolyspora gloriosae TaxID=455344 RepID=A0A840N9S8_9PSEU|nr:hypothetical protein [Saccharopolyspora gloriosae]MBB5066948.1 hypothetical protein [Saccharopolyspora gloriosae]
MTFPEPWSADGPMLSENTADAAEPRAGLAQPWRAAVAAAELVLVAALVVLAWWCWGRAQLAVEVSGATGVPVRSTRIFGDWAALGIAAPTLAAVLFVDAVRQLMLAWAVRRRPRRDSAA